jgi:hypothetical protein
MSSKHSLRPQQLLQTVEDYDHRESLTQSEFEALMQMSTELARPPEYDSQCFVLGSYDENEKQRLTYLKKELSNWTGEKCRPYLMDELPDGLPPRIQFKLIADNSDYIVGICEHDAGGFQLELGILCDTPRYFDRSFLLKRSYPDKDTEHEKYNWMLSNGVFDMFDDNDRIWEWETDRQYEVEVANVISTALD